MILKVRNRNLKAKVTCNYPRRLASIQSFLEQEKSVPCTPHSFSSRNWLNYWILHPSLSIAAFASKNQTDLLSRFCFQVCFLCYVQLEKRNPRNMGWKEPMEVTLSSLLFRAGLIPVLGVVGHGSVGQVWKASEDRDSVVLLN